MTEPGEMGWSIEIAMANGLGLIRRARHPAPLTQEERENLIGLFDSIEALLLAIVRATREATP